MTCYQQGHFTKEAALRDQLLTIEKSYLSWLNHLPGFLFFASLHTETHDL